MAWLLASLALSLLLLLAAAKAHGRQVRLERELEGHHEVVFGGDNPPYVVALWRRDRIRVWGAALLAALLLVALLVLGDAGRLPYPRVFAEDPTFGASLLLVPLWSLTAGFVVSGAWSLHSLARRMEEKGAAPAWRAQARRGSLLWWGIVAALAAAVAFLSA